MFKINEIGIVRSKFKKPVDPALMRSSESIIEIDDKYVKGLYRLEESEFIEIFFCFHKSKNYELETLNYSGERKGVFATRRPSRPSDIGLTKVRLLKVEKNILYVKGLDAIDGTPILDIKPIDMGCIADERAYSEYQGIKENPRKKIISLLKNNKTEELLTLSGTLHGHYCPGLAIGVIGSVYLVDKLKNFSDGMEEVICVMEINSCFADGIQYVTGCSMGNNSLIYRDFGKTAFSLVKRDGTGLRLVSKPSFRNALHEKNPEFAKYYNLVVAEQNRDEELLYKFKKSAKDACFSLLEWDINDIFKIESVKLDLPNYAPVRESVVCEVCGEEIMMGKEIIENNKIYCKGCVKCEYFQLDGSGITLN
jgi:formylmethanofuran dehydrogenase subunit E